MKSACAILNSLFVFLRFCRRSQETEVCSGRERLTLDGLGTLSLLAVSVSNPSNGRVDPRSIAGSLALAATQHRTFPLVVGKTAFRALGTGEIPLGWLCV
jgi:hypothetical protein